MVLLGKVWLVVAGGALYGWMLIGSVVIHHEPKQTKPRAFISIRAAKVDNQKINKGGRGNGSYTTIGIALKKYKNELLQDAKDDLDNYRNRYKMLNNLVAWSEGLTKARNALN